MTVQPAEHADVAAYDVIVMTEVLEHVRSPRDLMRRIAQGMKAGARLILTVPNGHLLTERLCRLSYAMKKSALGSRIVGAIKWILSTKNLTRQYQHASRAFLQPQGPRQAVRRRGPASHPVLPVLRSLAPARNLLLGPQD